MKKLIAGLAAIMILVCGCTAVFAEEKILTGEEAVQVALDQVALKEEEVTVTKIEMDREDGYLIWDIEFVSAYAEYEFAIDARTGRILARVSSRIHGHDNDRDDWNDIFDFD